MKQLITLISTENKISEQIAVSVKEAWAKYQKVKSETELKSNEARKEEKNNNLIVI